MKQNANVDRHSFSHMIKLELLKAKMEPKEMLELIRGIIFSNAHFQAEQNIIIRINDSVVSHLIRIILGKIGIKSFLIPKNKNWIMIRHDLQILERKIHDPSFFFAGVFVGSGSLSPLYSASYHLQISTWYESVVNLMQEKLSKYFNFSVIHRDDKYVLYLKKAESISDFLKSIKATKAFFAFEDEKILRDFNNSNNRQSSLDVYNQTRLVEATAYHLENYDLIKKHHLEHLFNAEELEFYKLKKDNPYSPLSELVVLLEKKKNIKKTKSCLNHWLIKLKKISNKI